MDNEKLNNEEELEVSEETVEEVVTDEEIEAELEAELGVKEAEEAEAAEEISEEQVEPKTVIVEKWQCTKCETINESDVCSVCGEPCELVEIEEIIYDDLDGVANYADQKRELSKGAKIGIIAGGAVVVILAVIALLWGTGTVNIYEKNIFKGTEYIDTTGKTLEEIADEDGYSVKEYKEMYDLPVLMPKNTNENAAMSHIPVGYIIEQENKYAEMYNFSGEEIEPFTIEKYREQFGLGDNITEKSTIGEARGEMTLETLFGLKDADEQAKKYAFIMNKAYYGFDDSVTLKTKYKDVRKMMDEKRRQAYLDPEKDQKDQEAAQAAALQAMTADQAIEETPVPEESVAPAPEESVAE